LIVRQVGGKTRVRAARERPGENSMINRKLAGASAIVALAAGLTFACTLPGELGGATQADVVAAAISRYDSGEWKYWGGDAGQTRYAPLDQINASNVGRLKVAWRWSADTSGDASSSNYKATPLLDDGVLYVPWLNHGAAAIDAGTGKTLWTFEPQPADIGGRGASLAPRSLAYWTDGKDKRLFHNSMDGRLISIDAKTGKADPAFGEKGWINLRNGLVEGRAVTDLGSVSPALVVNDIVVAQVIPGGSRNKESTPGYVRGFDVRTGKLMWTFHTVPQKGEPGYETWENNAADYIGNVGVWSMLSGDNDLDMVYLPTETPSNDFYGGHRLGDGLYAESIVALNAKTGKKGLALPDRPSRRVGLRQSGCADHPRHHSRGQKAARGDAADQAEPRVRVRRQDGRSHLADRREACPDRYRSRRAAVADATLPDQAGPSIQAWLR
jgi:glucose dehydrogenase